VDRFQFGVEPEPLECTTSECEALVLALVQGEGDIRWRREHVERNHGRRQEG
jgi:hypothetical protein